LSMLERRQITFAIARSGSHLRQSLSHSGLLERIGAERLYPSVGEAVAALRREE
jgi:hypothetical protein